MRRVDPAKDEEMALLLLYLWHNMPASLHVQEHCEIDAV